MLSKRRVNATRPKYKPLDPQKAEAVRQLYAFRRDKNLMVLLFNLSKALPYSDFIRSIKQYYLEHESLTPLQISTLKKIARTHGVKYDRI